MLNVDVTVVPERFLDACRKTNNKVISPTNHKMEQTWRGTDQNFLAIACNLQLLKTREKLRRGAIVLLLFG